MPDDDRPLNDAFPSPDDDSTLEIVHDSELLAEAVVDTIREPLLLLDAGLIVRLANRSFYRLFRITPQDALGAAGVRDR